MIALCLAVLHLAMGMTALCLIVLATVSIWITLDLASDDIAGAFRDALDAIRDLFRP